MKSIWPASLVLVVITAGCGGGGDGQGNLGNAGFGTVRGVIFDEQGLPVPNAHVFFDDGSSNDHRDTTSNSAGVYELANVPAGNVLVQADASKGAAHFVGTNLAQVLKGSITMNINLALYSDTLIAGVNGNVFDRQGNLISNATVSIKQATAGTVQTSNYGITDGQGHYSIPVLESNIAYNIQVNAVGYDSDVDTVTLSTGESRRLDFTLPLAANLGLGTPTHVTATAWTSPKTGRSPGFASVKENMKRLVLKNRYVARKTTTRDTATAFVEVDVTWDPVQNTHLLGYGIFRANGGSALGNIDFAQDPLAELYADMDPALFPGVQYTYGVESVTGASVQSPMSPTVSATPLGELVLGAVTGGARPNFGWQAATGATHYSIYVFSDYPSLGTTAIWDNSATPTTSLSISNDGPQLTTGQSYFYVVVGQSDTGSNSVSEVGQFVE